VENGNAEYSRAEMERAMKVQEVILRAMAGKLKWWEAAAIIGVTDRTMRRWRQSYEEFGYDGLLPRQRGKPSPKRISVETIERVLKFYQEQYFDFNVRHFHEKLSAEHDVQLSYTLVKNALQGAGLVSKQKRRSAHRRRRPRRPLPGMLLHMVAKQSRFSAMDGSTHAWFQDERWYDLIVILDDATSEIYYAQLVEEEGTRSVMAALREVIEKRGVFCALYSDRGTHFFVNPKAGEPVDKARLTQVGRALRELGVQMIPAYSPQARGRMERSYRTWQGRLPQELRIRGLKSREAANAFLRSEYIDEFNRRFAVVAEAKGSAFVKTRRKDLDLIFSIQHPRTVNQDNTVMLDNRVFQIEKTRWRSTLAGCTVVVHEHLDGSITIQFGPHEVARFAVGQLPVQQMPVRYGARPPGGKRASKLNGHQEELAIPSSPLIQQRSHPSSLPSGALRAGLTGPVYAAKGRLTRGNGELR
jgi:transposase